MQGKLAVKTRSSLRVLRLANMIEDHSQGDMHIEGQTLAIHGDENGRVADAKSGFGDAVILMAHDEARFGRERIPVVWNGVVS